MDSTGKGTGESSGPKKKRNYFEVWGNPERKSVRSHSAITRDELERAWVYGTWKGEGDLP